MKTQNAQEKKQQEYAKHVEKHEVTFFLCFLCKRRFVITRTAIGNFAS